MTNEEVSDERLCERAEGTLLGAACGDALGVPYEFGSAPFDPRRGPEPIGGGLGDYAPGEWSDDTQMAVCIARVAASGVPIDSAEGLDAIASGFLAWMAGDPADVGNQTRALLTPMVPTPTDEQGAGTVGQGAAGRGETALGGPGIAARMTQRARDLHESTGHTAGNGALMRTAPVALAFLEDRDRTAAAARRIAELTHTDPLAGDSCVLWCEAIRASVLTGEATGPEAGLDLLPPQRREAWTALVDGSWREGGPAALRGNGFTVTALYAALHAVEQAAEQAIEQVDDRDREHAGASEDTFRAGITTAVAIGGDTDTVAAIAGALLGARVGVAGVPAAWRRVVHGWPGMDAEDLTRMAGKILRA
ncbi:MAG: hypothetical protein DI611_11110 [Brachybacterium faecium]|nr:MAG: hypothetical protein DI611_11110 [Brachybacterium faecium]